MEQKNGEEAILQKKKNNDNNNKKMDTPNCHFVRDGVNKLANIVFVDFLFLLDDGRSGLCEGGRDEGDANF